MSLSEKVQQVNGEISATVERAINELREAVSRRLQASNEEILRHIGELAPALPASDPSPEVFAHDLAHTEREAGASARRDAQRGLRDGVAALDRARSQAEILSVLLKESAHHASRAALLLIRGGELRGWGSEGFDEAGDAIRNLVLTPQGGGWGQLLAGEGAVRLAAGECADLCSRVESPLPQEGVVVPLVLRDRLAAALYADRTGDSGLAAEALQVLAYVASQAIETLPFRERAATSTLTLLGEEPPAAPGSAPVAAPEPPVAPPVEAAVAEAPEVEVEVEAEPEYAASAPWTAEDEQSAVAAEPEPEEAPALPDTPVDPWEASPRYTEELQVASIAAAAASTAAPAAGPAEPEEAPRYPRSVEPEATAPVRFPDSSPEATVLLQRSAVQQAAEAADAAAAAPPAAPQPLRPVPVPPMATAPGAQGAGDEPAPALPGTPEVRPPSGVDGPGWAFATTRVPVSPSDETMHEEARRLARLLVSEIKLYNEEQVEEGRRNRDVYERLKEDIDRSRQMYEERVDPRILRSTDYFYQELVRILAAGDSRALGI